MRRKIYYGEGMAYFYGSIYKNIRFFSFFYLIAYVSIVLCLPKITFAGTVYGPAPSNAASEGAVPGSNMEPPSVPNGAVPSYNGPGFNAPSGGNTPSTGAQPSTPSSAGIMGSGQPGGSPSPNGGNGTAGQPPASDAPTFMNSAMPNSSNPFLPNNISPGLLSAPIENMYLQQGVPQLMAPMMSVVYRPFGLVYFQPSPFQVAPQGSVSVTGLVGEESNLAYQPNQSLSDWGSYFMIMPSVYYTNFDDYGYISLLGNASYYQFNGNNIPPFLDETAGINAGTYLGNRIFVGVQELGMAGELPQLNGTPVSFFTGITPYYENMADAEVGIALTPKISFVQGASDMYFDDSSFGAGIMNLQSLTDSLNYQDKVDYLSLMYTYQQGFFTLFPSFISDGISATAMRSLNQTTSIGVGGSGSYFLMGQGNLSFSPQISNSSNSADFYMYSYYGLFTRKFTRNLSVSLEGGWNGIVFYDGQVFQDPLVDFNLGYTGPRLGLGINAGAYMSSMSSYGVEMGPEYIKSVMGYLSYRISPLTTFFSSVGYSIYDFLSPYQYSNNYFQTLQPNQSYNGTYLSQTDGLSYTPYSWLNTSLIYTYMQFSFNLPNQSIGQNMFLATMTFTWNFM